MEDAHILVVDADRASRAELVTALSHCGHRVTCASEVKQALQQIAEGTFDLVLCAASMPDGEDFELVRWVRSADAWDLPIVLMSRDDSSSRRVRGLMLGADDFVGQPLDMAELTARVHALLRRTGRQQQLARDNLLDPLTKLLNRRGLRDAYDREQARIRRRGGSLALLVLDLDDFKAINDRHGHAAGDRVLCTVSRVLEHRVRTSDRVVRLGGDEFAVLMPDADERDAAVLAARISSLSPVQVALSGDLSVAVHFCTGLASGDLTDRLDQLLEGADARMYGAKREGSGSPSVEGRD